MKKYDFDIEPIFKYLTEGNAPMYRSIARFLYEKRTKQDSNATLNEILEMLKLNNFESEELDETRLKEILRRLENWEVIHSEKTKGKGLTIAEWNRNRFSYRLTKAAVEIESLLIRLDEPDQALISGLKSRQFNLLLRNLEIFKNTIPRHFSSREKTMEVWSGVFDTFKELQSNALNYLSHIERAEKADLFNTEAFLEFKDNIMQYLGAYINELTRNKYGIRTMIMSIPENHVEEYVDSVLDENKANALLYEDYSPETMRSTLLDKWYDLKTWFLGSGYTRSDIEKLEDRTNEAIGMIVAYAKRHSEAKNTASRIQDYKTLTKRLKESGSIENAHKLFAAVMGASHSRSLFASHDIEVQNDGVFISGEDIWKTGVGVFYIPNMSRSGPRRERKNIIIRDASEQQKLITIENMKRRKAEEEEVKRLIKDGRIVLAETEVLKPHQRKCILKWLNKSLQQRLGKKNAKKYYRTEMGLKFSVIYRSDEKRVPIQCTDGVLYGPDIILEFEGD
ncbi:TIGR02677 family protein [Anaerobacillus alkalidiazotrophicus]|uniref:TIGR02677 family protein n=1 Tax=Anaerobacillus alkalidiazotrophicus TaxID=472963 RepID=A0A1S2LYK5_9BACI|nr:TIGR02677 family protein [Anaerobacillus alkalidiazotrophicus]OIJ16515.1 TIGR02677 family protein [Anaerobacillus alkalidiazotrophicus]